jgi:hypothetical protein
MHRQLGMHAHSSVTLWSMLTKYSAFAHATHATAPTARKADQLVWINLSSSLRSSTPRLVPRITNPRQTPARKCARRSERGGGVGGHTLESMLSSAKIANLRYHAVTWSPRLPHTRAMIPSSTTKSSRCDRRCYVCCVSCYRIHHPSWRPHVLFPPPA